jgi:DNA-binding PadR family transcriptional regulator
MADGGELTMDPFERSTQDRVLAAVDGDRLSGFEALGRIEADGRAPEGEAFLYPALHRLEATGRLEADWSANASGDVRRRYRPKRR